MIPHVGIIGLCEPQPMTSDELRAWQKRMGFTYDSAAQALRIGRMTYANYLRTGKIPHVVFLATIAIEYFSELQQLKRDYEPVPAEKIEIEE